MYYDYDCQFACQMSLSKSLSIVETQQLNNFEWSLLEIVYYVYDGYVKAILSNVTVGWSVKCHCQFVSHMSLSVS